MDERRIIHRSDGFSLIELLLVLAILGVIVATGSISLSNGLRHQEARGAAQVWQAASGWTQVGVLWRGGVGCVTSRGESLSIVHDASLFGGDAVALMPRDAVEANLSRWMRDGGVSVSFSGVLASPDGGGSLFFASASGSYRVVVRPETGLTVRSWSGSQ